MAIEDGRASGTEAPQIPDEDIESILRAHGEAEERMYRDAPITWLLGTVALDTERGASEVNSGELAEAYAAGGFMEWEPALAGLVKATMKQSGRLN